MSQSHQIELVLRLLSIRICMHVSATRLHPLRGAILGVYVHSPLHLEDFLTRTQDSAGAIGKRALLEAHEDAGSCSTHRNQFHNLLI
jgi:hypothetical protein